MAIFDQTRGLLLFWMICGHAFYLAQLPLGHPLNYLRPGPVTASFVMLTGLLVGWIYVDRPTVVARDYRKLWFRGLQIGIVAYLSNVLFSGLRDLMSGGSMLGASMEAATFRSTWTISAILIVPALFLMISPVLIWVARRVGPLICFVMPTFFYAAVFFGERAGYDWATAIYAHSDLFRFAIWRLLLLSVCVFGLGAFLKAHRASRLPWLMLLTVCGTTAILVGVFPQLDEPVFRFGGVFAVFGITFLVAMIISRFPLGTGSLLASLGRSSLLVFLLHRAVIQALDITLMPHLSYGATKATALIVLTTAVCALACRIKESSATAKSLLAAGGM